jgi:hypothetical protein
MVSASGLVNKRALTTLQWCIGEQTRSIVWLQQIVFSGFGEIWGERKQT